MRIEQCALCDTAFDGPAFLVKATRVRARRRWAVRELICEPCYRLGWFDPETGLSRPAALRSREGFEWYRLAGRGSEAPAEPCANCQRPIVRNADPLLKRVTCSAACATSLTRIRNGNQGSGQPCETCGEQITTGRADSRYCGPACRQKAYRQRSSTGSRNAG